MPLVAVVALALWCGALVLVMLPAPLQLDATQLARQAFDLHTPELIDGRVAVFTRERPELPLPARSAGPAVVTLAMRAPAGVEQRRVDISLGGELPLPVHVEARWRQFSLLLPGGAPLVQHSALVLQTETSRFPNDDRRLGVVLGWLAITPDRTGPAWPGLAAVLVPLAALCLVALLLGRLGAPPASALALSAGLLATVTLLGTALHGGVALVAGALHAVLSLVRRIPTLRARRPAPWLPVAAAVIGLAAVGGAALATPGGAALTLQIAPALAAVLGGLWYVGFGLAWFLRTPRLGPAMPLLAPALGMAALTIAGHALATLPVGTDMTAWPLLALFTAINVLAWRRGARPRFTPAHAPAVAAGLIALVLATLPLYQAGTLTTMGMTIDAISYLTRAEQLRATGLLVLPAGGPAQPVAQNVAWQIITGMRQGDTFVLGFYSSLLNVRPHLVFPLLMAAWHALTAVGVYVLAAYVLGLGRWTAGLAALLAAVNALLHWALMDTFLSQVTGTALWCFTLAAVVTAWRGGWRAVVLGGFMAGALASFYHVFLLLLAAPAALAALYELWRAAQWGVGGAQPRRKNSLLDSPVLSVPSVVNRGTALLARAIGMAAIAVAVVPAGWWLLWQQLTLIGGAVRRDGIEPGAVGNIVVFPHPAEVFGLANHAADAHGLPVTQLAPWLATTLGLLCAALVLYGIVRARGRARWLMGSLLVCLVAALLQQRFWYDMGRGYPYGYYKIISLAAPVAMLLLAAGVAALVRDAARLQPAWRDGVRTMALGLLAAVTCISLVHLGSTAAFVNRFWLQADRATLEVQEAARLVPADEPLLIVDERHPGRSWLLYLVRHPQVYGREPNPGWPMAEAEASPTPVRYALIADPETPRIPRLDEPWFDAAKHEVVWRNERYALLRAREGGAP
jgi:hypothetical protein